MNFQNLLIQSQNDALWVTINRPDKLNALNRLTIQELDALFSNTNYLKTHKAIVITGQGTKAFVAGADISEFSSYTKEEAIALSKYGQDVFLKIEQSSVPVIAAINGYALGGGCELALACHIRFASDNALLGLPEVSLGLIPGYGGTQRLPLIIGQGKALELILSGTPRNATWAHQCGLVNEVFSQDQLTEEVWKFIEVLKQKSPQGQAAAIQAIVQPGVDYELEAQAFGQCFNTNDFKEGTTAFLEKRKPNFK